MKLRHLLGLMAILCLSACGTADDFNPSDYVNPNLGTIHSRWFFYTPAARPFGMAKLGASTNGTYGNVQGWEAVGYEDGHTSIDGFPCLHEFQVGGVSLMPVTGELKTIPGSMENPDEGFRSRFDKADEHARPGYYSVVLKDYGVKAELTATDRVGFQRYTFPESEQSRIIFNIGNRQGESGPVVDAYIKMLDPQTVEGYVITEPVYVQKYQAGATVPMYFYAVLDKPAESASVFHQGGEAVEAEQINGVGVMMALNFKTKASEEINVKLGLSYTSIENAKLNLETEASDLTFDKALAEAEDVWEESLGRIKVYGGSQDSKVKFYTGLYHAILGRGLASDVNGAYPKNDGTVGMIEAGEDGQPKHHHYNTDAVWGAYWNLTQLWMLAYPEYYNEFVNSQLLVYKDAGWLGDGIANSKYVSGVGTNMTSIAIAAAYNNGIRDYDVDLAYEAALKNEIGWEGRIEGAGKMDTKQWVERGYIPYDDSIFFGTHAEGSQFSVSHTVEYSFSSAAVAQFAKSLGHEADYAQLTDLSKGWERCFDEDLKMLRPKMKDGSFIDNFNPLESWRGFQEGNAMQYTFFVPHDPEGLVEKVGEKEFNHRLDSIFTVARESIFGGGKTVHAFAGLYSPYNHGNQPNLHISWLFNWSGKPWLSQKWTRLICDEFYGTGAEHGYGYGQDEDQGQLGAWYVMAAMGLFDVKGGTAENPDMQIGSPQFDRIEIALSPVNATGKKFVIETVGNSPEAMYVQSATLNGQPQQSCRIPNSEIFKGGKLVLEMGTEPNMNWGL